MQVFVISVEYSLVKSERQMCFVICFYDRKTDCSRNKVVITLDFHLTIFWAVLTILKGIKVSRVTHVTLRKCRVKSFFLTLWPLIFCQPMFLVFIDPKINHLEAQTNTWNVCRLNWCCLEGLVWCCIFVSPVRRQWSSAFWVKLFVSLLQGHAIWGRNLNAITVSRRRQCSRSAYWVATEIR